MPLKNETRLRLARIGKGWSLEDLSKRCSYSISYLSKMERGKRLIPEIVVRILDLNEDIWYDKLIKHLPSKLRAVIDSLNNALQI